MTSADSPLWQFAVQFYQAGDVAQQCLRLQDESGDDVNLLLLCCWCDNQGMALSSAYLGELAADQSYRQWREHCIVPLRSVRRGMKPLGMTAAQVLRQQLAALELQAEQCALEILYERVQGLSEPRVAPGPELLRDNLQHYRLAIAGEPLGGAELLPFLYAAYPAWGVQELSTLAAVRPVG